MEALARACRRIRLANFPQQRFARCPMNRARRALIVGLYVFGFVGLLARQAPQPAPPTVNLSLEETEAFLLKAKIVSKKGVKTGVTDTTRAMLSDGQFTHEAQIQSVDIYRTTFEAGKASEVNFKDTYRFNIGGYRLARL